MKANIKTIMALLLIVTMCVAPACSSRERSKSVEEAETYDDLLMEFEDDEEDEVNPDDADDHDDADDSDDSDDSDDADDSVDAENADDPDSTDDPDNEDKKITGKSATSYKARLKQWKEHEKWRDKEVDKFKTPEEYADYYHDEYIALYMEQYYAEDNYDENFMLEQSYLDAIHHWEVNQPWPKPKK